MSFFIHDRSCQTINFPSPFYQRDNRAYQFWYNISYRSSEITSKLRRTIQLKVVEDKTDSSSLVGSKMLMKSFVQWTRSHSQDLLEASLGRLAVLIYQNRLHKNQYIFFQANISSKLTKAFLTLKAFEHILLYIYYTFRLLEESSRFSFDLTIYY